MLNNIIKYTSFPMVNKNLFDDFFENFFNDKSWFAEKKPGTYPMNVVRIKDSEGNTTAVKIEYALAGFSKNEINVSIKNNVLHINAEKTTEPETEKNEEIAYRGISYKNLSIAYQLMNEADKQNIKSKFEDGLLSITIPINNNIEFNKIEIE